MNGQRRNDRVQARDLSKRSFTFRDKRSLLEKDDRRRSIFDDAAGGIHGADGGDAQSFLFGFEFTAGGSAELGVVTDQQNGMFSALHHLFPRCIFLGYQSA